MKIIYHAENQKRNQVNERFYRENESYEIIFKKSISMISNVTKEINRSISFFHLRIQNRKHDYIK